MSLVLLSFFLSGQTMLLPFLLLLLKLLLQLLLLLGEGKERMAWWQKVGWKVGRHEVALLARRRRRPMHVRRGRPSTKWRHEVALLATILHVRRRRARHTNNHWTWPWTTPLLVGHMQAGMAWAFHSLRRKAKGQRTLHGAWRRALHAGRRTLHGAWWGTLHVVGRRTLHGAWRRALHTGGRTLAQNAVAESLRRSSWTIS